jgi:hypothetical protein
MKNGVVVLVTRPMNIDGVISFGVIFYSTSDKSLDTLIDVNSAGITINNLYRSGFDLVSCISISEVEYAQYTFVKGH